MAASVLRPAATPGPDATLRLADVPAPSPFSGAGPRPGASGSQGFIPPVFPPSQASPEALSKAVAAQLQPLVREEVAAILAQVQAQAQTLNTLDGRLQSLPPLVAAELRAALAQHDRNTAAARAAAPAPAAGSLRGVLIAMGVGMAVLLAAVVALALKALR